ncbi:tyrosine-type recombinase/integrase [Pseudomonas palleroniana]|uniref:Uncharacterized protein n=1 Tax=Pseudomonas palleroniana TaxID=191390 RepID=A0A0X7K0M6_9PSED|nr:tyrosine-type recombinase/integrase [Pseudomonas palleroniana]KWU48290.1 hypothetical protein AWV77_25485 [Pseudomonas palleroniana]
MKKLNKINNYGDPIFHIHNHFDDQSAAFPFEWNCSRKIIKYGQMLFVNSTYVNNFADDENRIVVSRFTTAKNGKDYIQKICEYWHSIHPDIALWDWSRQDIIEFVRMQMVKKATTSPIAPLYASHALKNYCMFINQSRNQHTQGTLPDGFQFNINDQARRDIMEPLLLERGLTYEEWQDGDSYGMIPLPIASVLLANAIELLESKESVAAYSFFSVWRRHTVHPSNCFWKKSGSKLDRLQRYFRDRHSENLLPIDKDFGETFQEAGLGDLTKLPWKSVGGLSDFCKNLMKASLTILLLLSGFRISEIMSLRFCDYEKNHGEWVYKSSIFKTHEGLRVPRVLHDLTALAAKCLQDISYLDPEKYSLNFFHRGFMEGAATAALQPEKNMQQWALGTSSFNLKTVSRWLNDFYQNFTLNDFPILKKECERISPHQCRHTWAAFALRRMDGNVEERIREHFLHSSGSSMTKAYTKLKLNEAIKNSLEEDYSQEVVMRIAKTVLGDRFTGPAARRIIKAVGNISTITSEELDKKIQDVSSEIERFSATEWGFCVFFKGSEKTAKCYDPVSRLPDIDGGSGPTICPTCPNGMHNPLQEKNLIRVGIQHQHISNTHPIKAIGKLSADIVQNIKKRLEGK